MQRMFLLFSTAFLLLTSNAQSQDLRKPKELGIKLNGLSDLDLFLKKKLKEDKYLRCSFLSLNARLNDNNQVANSNIGAGIGIEKRKDLSKDLDMILGWEVNAYFSMNNYKDQAPEMVIKPGLGFVVGTGYQLNQKVYVSLETMPTILANIIKNETGTYFNSLNAGLDTRSVSLGLAYKL